MDKNNWKTINIILPIHAKIKLSKIKYNQHLKLVLPINDITQP